MGLLAPNPRKLLKKLDQNFQTLVQCEHSAFDRRVQKLKHKPKPQFQSFWKMGYGEEKLFLKSFLPRLKDNLIPLFLWHKRRKEKAWQKESAVITGLLAPNPRKLLKKLDQNFHTRVQCEHCTFERRAQTWWQKNNPQVSKFLKVGGVGEGKLLLRSFLPPHNKKQ